MLQVDANRKYWECSELARTNWVLLTEALKQKFNPESSRATFEAALEIRKRKQNETLDKYMSELRSLARKAFPDWDTTYRDKLVRKYFIDGLEDNLRIWVLQSNPKTSDEALQVALRSEANLKQKSAVKAEVTPSINASQPTGTSTVAATHAHASQPTGTSDLADAIVRAMQMAGIAERGGGADVTVGYSGAMQQYRGRGRGRGKGRGACHLCGQIGHFWRDAVCPNFPMN